MSPPIYTPDGSEVSEIVLPDGSTASEVIGPDGNVVFEAGPDIPDSELLQARYDATELTLNGGDVVSTWTDESGNGHDLTSGTGQTYQTSVINGNSIVRFDGSNDYMDVDWTALSGDQWVFIVAKGNTTFSDSSNDYLWSVYDGTNNWAMEATNDPGSPWRAPVSSGDIENGSSDQDPHLFGFSSVGSGSVFRIDGAEIGSAENNTNLNGIMIGAYEDSGPRLFGAYDVGEILVYDGPPTVSDVESYLSDKWGITI